MLAAPLGIVSFCQRLLINFHLLPRIFLFSPSFFSPNCTVLLNYPGSRERCEGFVGFNLKTPVVQLEKELRAAFSIRKRLIPVFFGISCWIKPSRPSQNIPNFCCFAKGSFGSFGSLDCVIEDKVLRTFCGQEHGKCPDSSQIGMVTGVERPSVSLE